MSVIWFSAVRIVAIDKNLLYAIILYHANDFIGGAVGQSQTQTSAIIKNCEGKVLLIDEAYNLDDQDYGSKALDTIVELVSAKPGANMAVIMAGYEKEMMKMLRDQNAGLSRRFDPASALYFHDFDNKSLGLILKRNCQKQNLTLSMNVRRAVVQELSMPFGSKTPVVPDVNSKRCEQMLRRFC